MSSRPFHIFRRRLSSIRLSALFAPRKPRHPLLRVAFGLLGLVLLALLIVVGVFVGAAMVIGGVMLRLVRPPRPARQSAQPRVAAVDAEYRIVRRGSRAGSNAPLLR